MIIQSLDPENQKRKLKKVIVYSIFIDSGSTFEVFDFVTELAEKHKGKKIEFEFDYKKIQITGESAQVLNFFYTEPESDEDFSKRMLLLNNRDIRELLNVIGSYAVTQNKKGELFQIFQNVSESQFMSGHERTRLNEFFSSTEKTHTHADVNKAYEAGLAVGGEAMKRKITNFLST